MYARERGLLFHIILVAQGKHLMYARNVNPPIQIHVCVPFQAHKIKETHQNQNKKCLHSFSSIIMTNGQLLKSQPMKESYFLSPSLVRDFVASLHGVYEPYYSSLKAE